MSNDISGTYWSNLEAIARSENAESLLVRQFRAFYATLLRLKHEVQDGTYVPSARGADASRSDGGTPEIQRELVTLLHDQKQAAQRNGGTPLLDRCERAQYAMVALADEVFLNLDWSGRDYWYNHLLETRQFDSQNAGDQVFAIIDDLVNQRAASADVATVYLYTLILGFEGKYRNSSDASPLRERRRALYQHIQHQASDRLSDRQPLSPDAYRHTLDHGTVRLLPNLRGWTSGLGAVVAVYLIVSTLLWWWHTDELADLAQQILESP